MISIALKSTLRSKPVGSRRHFLQTRIIIKPKARSTTVLWLELRRMHHSNLNICKHLLELFMKRFVLNRRFAGIRFALRFRLGGIGRHSVWVVTAGT